MGKDLIYHMFVIQQEKSILLKLSMKLPIF